MKGFLVWFPHSLHQVLPVPFSAATSEEIAAYCYSSVRFAQGMAFYIVLRGIWQSDHLQHLLIAMWIHDLGIRVFKMKASQRMYKAGQSIIFASLAVMLTGDFFSVKTFQLKSLDPGSWFVAWSYPAASNLCTLGTAYQVLSITYNSLSSVLSCVCSRGRVHVVESRALFFLSSVPVQFHYL